MTEIPDPSVCPICNDAEDCDHLLLVLERASNEPVEGMLFEEAWYIENLFHELFFQVYERQAICGEGLVYEATRLFFRNYGLIAGTNIPHAELDRYFGFECIMELLDIAPNLTRGSDGDNTYIWSDMQGVALDLVRKQAEEMLRLIGLPKGSPEWVPQSLNDMDTTERLG